MVMNVPLVPQLKTSPSYDVPNRYTEQNLEWLKTFRLEKIPSFRCSFNELTFCMSNVGVERRRVNERVNGQREKEGEGKKERDRERRG